MSAEVCADDHSRDHRVFVGGHAWIFGQGQVKLNGAWKKACTTVLKAVAGLIPHAVQAQKLLKPQIGPSRIKNSGHSPL